MIAIEYKARLRLSGTLHHQVCLETLMHTHANQPLHQTFRALAKSHAASLLRDVHAFATARLACRRHVLVGAKVRQEPDRLINSSLWGEGLFPKEEIDRVREAAARDNKNLMDRWQVLLRCIDN